jgi:hypothetical protein
VPAAVNVFEEHSNDCYSQSTANFYGELVSQTNLSIIQLLLNTNDYDVVQSAIAALVQAAMSSEIDGMIKEMDAIPRLLELLATDDPYLCQYVSWLLNYMVEGNDERKRQFLAMGGIEVIIEIASKGVIHSGMNYTFFLMENLCQEETCLTHFLSLPWIRVFLPFISKEVHENGEYSELINVVANLMSKLSVIGEVCQGIVSHQLQEVLFFWILDANSSELAASSITTLVNLLKDPVSFEVISNESNLSVTLRCFQSTMRQIDSAYLTCLSLSGLTVFMHDLNYLRICLDMGIHVDALNCMMPDQPEMLAWCLTLLLSVAVPTLGSQALRECEITLPRLLIGLQASMGNENNLASALEILRALAQDRPSLVRMVELSFAEELLACRQQHGSNPGLVAAIDSILSAMNPRIMELLQVQALTASEVRKLAEEGLLPPEPATVVVETEDITKEVVEEVVEVVEVVEEVVEEVVASYHELLLAGEGIFTPVAWQSVPSRSAEAAEALLQEGKDREMSRELLESRLVHEEQLNKDLQGMLDASKKEEAQLSKLLWEVEAKAKANDQHYELSLMQSELARRRQEQNDKARIMKLMVKLASAEQVVENGTSLPENATSSNDEVSKLQAKIVELECQIEVSRAQSKEMEERCQARIVEEKKHAFISIRSAHESNLRSLAQVRDGHAMQLLVEEEKRLRLETEVNSQAAKAREEYQLLEGVNSSNQNEISALLAKIDVLELERGLLEQRVAMVTAKADDSQSRCDELEKRLEKLLKSGDFGGEADVWREKAVACEIQLVCQVEKHGKWKRRARQLREELGLLQEQWRESQVSMIQLQTKVEVQKVLQLRESDQIQQIEQTREQEKVQWQNEKELWVQRADELERQVAAVTGEREEMTRKHSAVEDRLHRIREVYGMDVESALDEFVKKLSYQEKTINLLRRELSQAHQTAAQSRAEAEAKSQSYQEVSRQLSLLQQSRSKRSELAPIVGVASPPSTGETYRRTNIYRSALEAGPTSASASKSNSQCENENDRAVSMTPTAPAVDRSPHPHASPRTQHSSLYGREVVRIDSTVVKT